MECNCANCQRSGGVAGPASSPYTFANFNTQSISVDLDGTGIATAFPVMTRVGLIDLNTNAGLFAVTVASSLTIETGVGAIFLALDQGQTVRVDGLSRMFLSHVSNVNSLAGLPNPSSRTNSLQFGQQSYFRLASGQKLAVYASAANNAANLVRAAVTAFWIPLN